MGGVEETMLGLSLPPAPRILCLGAHCDDVEIGCGGTLLSIREAYPEARMTWVVFASTPKRKRELAASAERYQLDSEFLRVEEFRDGFFPYHGAQIKEVFESLKPIQPDVIFTHYRADAHQDHRLISELTWNTFRDHLILEYEIPKWDGDLGRPNVYVPLSQQVTGQKIRFLMEAYPSQAEKAWFCEETFRGLLRLRGMESCAEERYAEAFYGPKLRVSLDSSP